jgi:hypothetical protein
VSALFVFSLLFLANASHAEVYRVGPGQEYAKVSKVTAKLKPGDVVEVTGDIEESFVLSRYGAKEKPITIRGITRAEGAQVVRPKLTFPEGSSFGIICRGDWNVIEGLDISGALDAKTFMTGTAIYSHADNLVIRNCRIHHNRQGVFGDDEFSGSTVIEFCEFDSNGGKSSIGSNMHSVYLCSRKPGALSVVQHCYFHDAIAGVFVKTRCTRNLVQYNWFENPYFSCATAVDTSQVIPPPDEIYPMHTDVLGNVFFQGWSPGPKYSLLSLGGEDAGTPGTEGDFNIAHNLFVVTKRLSTPCILVHGNVDHVALYNNVFVDFGVNDWLVYDRGIVWDAPRTKVFTDKRANGEPILSGSNNWVSDKGGGIPAVLLKTIRGMNPGFTHLVGRDFRPRKDSPLAGAGLSPLPKGRIVDLVPQFEPRRGIAPDLKPARRRATAPPSIGPFEPPE